MQKRERNVSSLAPEKKKVDMLKFPERSRDGVKSEGVKRYFLFTSCLVHSKW
jgi:hypothetical protein